jgi:Smg protein
MEPRLDLVIAELRRRFGREDHVADVEAWLSSQGYDGGQIGTIVSAWLSDIRAREGVLPTEESWPVRVQGPHERGRFSVDAWGYLLGLRASGVLGPMELEHVIDRLMMQVDGRVSLEDARSVVDTGFADGNGSPGEPLIVH